MPFESGSVSFRICYLPQEMPEDMIERFAAKAAGPLEKVKDEPQWGWVSGRHLLETRIDEETAYAGGYLHLCLRQAQRKIPASLLQAECRMAELAAIVEQKLEVVPRKQRKAIKQDITDRLLPTMPPQLSGIRFAIDNAYQRLYVTATSDSQLENFVAYFYQAAGFEPVPMTPEVVAVDLLEKEPSALPALNFSPELPDGNAAGSLGQNFLTWLWFFIDQREGVLKTQLGEFSMMIDGPLVFVADGPGALESSIRKGLPTISAEAKAALTVGKKLKQAKLTLARGQGEMWNVSLDADNFTLRGMKLPDGEAMDPGSIFEERMTNLYVFQTVLFELFKFYLKEVSDPARVKELQAEAKQWVAEMDGK